MESRGSSMRNFMIQPQCSIFGFGNHYKYLYVQLYLYFQIKVPGYNFSRIKKESLYLRTQFAGCKVCVDTKFKIQRSVLSFCLGLYAARLYNSTRWCSTSLTQLRRQLLTLRISWCPRKGEESLPFSLPYPMPFTVFPLLLKLNQIP